MCYFNLKKQPWNAWDYLFVNLEFFLAATYEYCIPLSRKWKESHPNGEYVSGLVSIFRLMPSFVFVGRGLSGLGELLAVPDRLRAYIQTHKGHERKTVTLSEKTRKQCFSYW